MKAVVRADLEREGYAVVEEPLSCLEWRTHWSGYRPDLLGHKSEDEIESIALVECETRPSTARLLSKRFRSVWFQPVLLRRGWVRRILAVHQGRLGGIDMLVRSEWEIWIVNSTRVLQRLRSLPERGTRYDHAAP